MFELPAYLHPMVVHFPIALFVAALGLDLMSLVLKKETLHRTALHIYLVAALVAPVAVITGIWEKEKLNLHHPLLHQHEVFAFWAMWISLVSLPVLYVLKTKSARCFRIIFIIFLITITSIIAVTAKKGGQMVYEYGVGVEQ